MIDECPAPAVSKDLRAIGGIVVKSLERVVRFLYQLSGDVAAMTDTVLLNHTEIKPYSFNHEVVVKEGRSLNKITLDFKVKSSDYHEITALLYNQNLKVNVPRLNLAFQGTISNYITSLTNLYEEGAVGDFHLELIED